MPGQSTASARSSQTRSRTRGGAADLQHTGIVARQNIDAWICGLLMTCLAVDVVDRRTLKPLVPDCSDPERIVIRSRLPPERPSIRVALISRSPLRPISFGFASVVRLSDERSIRAACHETVDKPRCQRSGTESVLDCLRGIQGGER